MAFETVHALKLKNKNGFLPKDNSMFVFNRQLDTLKKGGKILIKNCKTAAHKTLDSLFC